MLRRVASLQRPDHAVHVQHVPGVGVCVAGARGGWEEHEVKGQRLCWSCLLASKSVLAVKLGARGK